MAPVHPKVKIGSLVGALMALATFLLTHPLDTGVPPWLASLVTMLAVFVAAWLTPSGAT